MSLYVGIDIAKGSFEAALPEAGTRRVQSYPNAEQGFAALLASLPEPAHCVMEASGPYTYRLAAYLQAQGVTTSIVNPLVVRRFAQMLLSRAKTDRADALLITRYAEAMRPEPTALAAAELSELQQRRAALEQLSKQRTQLRNGLEALSARDRPSQAAREALSSVLEQVEQALSELERGTDALVAEHYGDLVSRLRSVKGIGRKTAAELVLVTGGFTRFSTAKQLVAYVGLSPRIYESGTSVRGKTRLSKLGMSRTRRLLYMCAQSALRHNEGCRALYERLLGRGKPKMVALLAVAHKLLRQAFAVASKGVMFDESHGLQAASS